MPSTKIKNKGEARLQFCNPKEAKISVMLPQDVILINAGVNIRFLCPFSKILKRVGSMEIFSSKYANFIRVAREH